MNRRLLILAAIAIPLLLFANAYQAYRYNTLEREIRELEEQQLALIEENKRAILAITILSSPQRIGPIAEEELSLIRLDLDSLILMEEPR